MANSRDRNPERQGLWTRFLMSIMGPPQLGDSTAPIRPSRPDLDLCPKCGYPLAEHEPVRTARATFLRCPPDSPLQIR
jgi:hypothetical protein